MPVATVANPGNYNFWAYGLDEPLLTPTLDTFSQLGSFAASSPALAQARGAAVDTGIIRNQLTPFEEHEGKPGFTLPGAATRPTEANSPSVSRRSRP